MRTRACLRVFALTTCVALSARAGDVAKARKIFADGVRLYQAGDWEGARRLFREADTEHHAPAIVYNLGLAEEKLGHPQAAIDAYEAYLAESGDKGDLSASAATAIAQIKSRATRLRLETRPSNARLFIDGSPIAEPSPTTHLVLAGHHIIVAQGDGWRGERDVEVKGAGDVLNVMIEQEAPTPVAVPVAIPVAPPTEPVVRDTPPIVAPPPKAPANEERPDGLVWAASFAMAPTYLLGVTTPNANNGESGLSIVAGPLVEVGYALSDRFEFALHGFGGIGPDAKPSYAFMGGPGLSYKLAPVLWLGATFIGGQLETKAHGVRYGTDLVFGAMIEASFVVIKKPAGEWLVSAQPGVLLTEMSKDNTAFFFPFAFGFRAY